MNNNIISFISNNVKGIQQKEKRIKIFEYLKNNISLNGFVFIQETHSSVECEKGWNDDFGGKLFFSHGKTNSCGVAIGYVGSMSFDVTEKKCDTNGRILILDAKLNDDQFLLINIYNSNNESDQLVTLSELITMLEKVVNISEKKIVLGGDFNTILDVNLDSNGGNPSFKKKTYAKIVELIETFELCDIWRIRNPKTKRFTFRQNHFSGFIQRRLDYFFVSNTLQECIKNPDILASFATDHSPIVITYSKNKEFKRGKGLWKFNSSLCSNSEFTENMKNHIKSILDLLNKENITDDQVIWEYLKYEIRKFSIQFSKKQAKILNEERVSLEKNLKQMEKELGTNVKNYPVYNDCKSKLDRIYAKKVEGIRTRSRCNWYEHGEKSSKFFLTLEKTRAVKGQIRNILIDNSEVTEEKEINEHLFSFYECLFTQKNSKNNNEIKSYLKNVEVAKLSDDIKEKCENGISEKELWQALRNMPNDKSPGNDGLTKEFYETFWEDIKSPLVLSFKKSFLLEELSVSQKQAVIKLIEKKDRDKRYIKNWRPISLLNVDVKILSKALAERLKEALPDLISPSQLAYVKGRCISEGGRLISDIIEVSNMLQKKGFLLTIDIEKAFDSVNHNFLIAALENYGFGKKFIRWIRTLLKNQESCIINGGKTTKYFKLLRGTRQGDPISAYLFILVLEIVFAVIKQNPKINGLEFFQNKILYTAYADDTTFFLKNKKSVEEVLFNFNEFSIFSGLKPNLSKCEIAGIGALKGVKVALCGMQCINLKEETLKILGIHFSYNENREHEENFKKHIVKMEKVLKMWKMRNLTIEGKITIFKSLAISKIVHLAFVKHIPKYFIELMDKMQKRFVWNGLNPKIKHTTLCANYECGGLKNVDIFSKIVSLQCSWVKRLYDENFHQWKIIPNNFIKNYLGINFRFHSNVSIKKSIVQKFPKYYQDIIIAWSKNLSTEPKVPSSILSQFLWFNEYIKVDNTSIYFSYFADEGLGYVNQLFDSNGKLFSWEDIKMQYNLKEHMKFKWMQIISALPVSWKRDISDDKGLSKNLVLQDHHLIKRGQHYCLQKLDCKEIYNLQILLSNVPPTSQKYFEKMFVTNDINWRDIYLLPRLATIDTTLRIFQYKILHNVLYLNEKLFIFKKTLSPLCSFCGLVDETPNHVFGECVTTKKLWSQLQNYFSYKFAIPDLTPQSAILGFPNIDPNINLVTNHLLLIFKYNVYKSRDNKKLCFEKLRKNIIKVYNTEKRLGHDNSRLKKRIDRKWKIIQEFF